MATSASSKWHKLKLANIFVNNIAAPTCLRCTTRVYPTEKITSSKDGIFHNQCFSCKVCGGKLTTSNHRTSPNRDDEEVYCATHVPKLESAKVGLDSFGIVSAVEATKMRERLQKKKTIRAPKFGMGSAGIDHALRATNLNRAAHYKGGQSHQFPYLLLKPKDEAEIQQAQVELEERHRLEEEEVLKKVDERSRDEVAKETKKDWEKFQTSIEERLTAQFEKKKGSEYESEKKRLEKIGWEQLQKKEKEKIKYRTIKLAREETAALVDKQGEEMLGLLAQKKKEVFAKEYEKLQEEIHSHQTYEHAPINGRKAKVSESEVDTESGVFEDTSSLMAAMQPEEFINSVDVMVSAPEHLKADLYNNCTAEDVFKELDDYVVEIANMDHTTFTELSADLTADLMSDLAKARAIFRWITVKDLNTLAFDEKERQGDNPLGLLKGIKYGTETYHTLFKRLCNYAGLQCKEVKGRSKSVGYEPGMMFEGDTFRNTWNMVCIDKQWRLIQCNWGARHLVLNKDQGSSQQPAMVSGGSTLKAHKDKIRYQYDEHYFLTDPEEFIREFFPDEQEYQLLREPIMLSDFINLPFVRSVFYHYGMRFKENYPSVLETDKVGGTEIRIELPETHCRDLILHYQLRFAHKGMRHEVEYKGARLDRFVFQSMLHNEVVYSVHVPTVGEYFLEIFANKVDETNEESMSANVPFRLKCACKFKIVCKELSNKMHALPNCASGEWGPAKAIRHFRLFPKSHPKGVINEQEQSEIVFEAQKALHFLVKLRMNGVDDHFLDQFVQARAEGDMFYIKLRYPVAGQYGLDIYARPQALSPGVAGQESTLAHACKYLINCEKVVKPIDLGQARCDVAAQQSRERWGPQPLFKKLGLKAEPSTPKIKNSTSFEQVTLDAPLGLNLSFHFIREPSDDYRDCVTMQRSASGMAHFTINMTKPGHYMLAIYGRKESSNSVGSAKGERGSEKSKDKYRIDNLFNYLFVYDPESTLRKKNVDRSKK